MPNKLITADFLPNKIKIPKKLFTCTISLLESLDIEDYSPDIIQLFGYVFFAFNNKKASFQFRDPFAKPLDPNVVQSSFDQYPDYDSHSDFDGQPF